MSRTENDIRAALLEVAQTAASADDVANRLHIRESSGANHRRRDFLVIAAACLIVAAVAAASALLVTRHQRSAPAVVSPIHMPLGPKFAFSFQVGDLPPNLTVVTQGIEPTGQWALVGRKLSPDCLGRLFSAQDPARRDECLGISPAHGGAAGVTDGYLQLGYVFIFSKGEFDPAMMRAATTVNINGALGLFSEIAQPLNAPALRIGYSSSAPLPTIAWPYARDSWAVAIWRNSTDIDARGSVIALARATRIGGSHPARVPFTVAYLPASIDRRLELLSGRERDANTVTFGTAASTAPDVEHGLPDRALPITVLSTPFSQVGLSYGPGREFAASKGDVSLSVAGHPAWYSPKWSALYVSCGATCTLVIGENAANGHLPEGVGEAELINVAEGITVAPSLTDTSTWFDAATALPH